MQGLAEAIQTIERMAVEARAEPAVIDVPGGSRMVLHDGTLGDAFSAPVRDRAHTIDGLADLVNDYDLPARVYVGETGVEAVLDQDLPQTVPSDRVHRVALALPFAGCFTALAKGLLENLEQPDAVWKLRTLYPGGRITPDGFLPAIRNLKWTASGATSRRVDHGRESMGREVEEAVAGVSGELPDEITVTTPVYESLHGATDEHGKRVGWPVRLAVKIDVERKLLSFVPLGGELVAARAKASAFIAARLHERITADGSLVIDGATPNAMPDRGVRVDFPRV